MEISKKLERAGKKFRLTRRELQVLAALSTGAKYLAVADNLEISCATVKFHTRNILRKTQSVSVFAAFAKLTYPTG